MQIFQTEILDGISEVVQANASVAFESDIVLTSEKPSSNRTDIEKTLAGYGFSNPDQIDLYYLNSVLVSTGWNRNDDVFDPGEAWAAKDTPVDKQFNYMHDESDIIGHITGSMVVDKNGDQVESEDMPEVFDIVTSAVLYKSWSDPELRERMDTLIQEIEEGKWAVSMECLFSNFDYSVVSPDGGMKVVARDESSSFLTKHLRVYGGQGEYEGYKVGRLLRGIAFSGKGLVNKPANPRSIILDTEENPFEESNTNLSIEEFCMSAENEIVESSEVELEAAAASVNEELEAIKAEQEAIVAGFEATIAGRDAKIEEMEAGAAALAAEIEEVKAELAGASEKLSKAKAENRKMVREAAAKDAGITEEKIEETVAAFDAVDDEAFSAMLDLVKTQASDWRTAHVSMEEEAAAPVAPEAPEAPAVEEVAEVEEVVEEEVVEEEAPEAVIEEAEVEETEAALVEAPEPVQTGFTSAAEYFRKSVLKTTKNLK
jgi:hypothetical protein